MTREFKIEVVLNEMAAGIGGSLDDTFGFQEVGFVLLLIDSKPTDDDGSRCYASFHANRVDTIKSLQVVLARLIAGPAKTSTDA